MNSVTPRQKQKLATAGVWGSLARVNREFGTNFKFSDVTVTRRLDGKAVYVIPRQELAHGGDKRVAGACKLPLKAGSMRNRVVFAFRLGYDIDEFRKENKRLVLFKGHPNIVKPAKFVGVRGPDGEPSTLVVQKRYRACLADVIPNGGVPYEVQRTIAVGMGRGLKAVHDKGLIHRDLKPDNVMIESEDFESLKVGDVKLADFGNACKLDEVKWAYEGTTDYMAFEGNLSVRSDLYGYGQALYVAATGRMPGVWLSHDPRLDKAVEGVEPKVKAVIKACVEPYPFDRPKSIDEVLKMLDGVVKI